MKHLISSQIKNLKKSRSFKDRDISFKQESQRTKVKISKKANTHISEPDFATTMESSTVTFGSNEKLKKTAVSLAAMVEENISTSSSETGEIFV